ncbi:hypothetical protein GA0070624_4302 [Micromonospora rhizosphaerae]|uniref:Uncharacterized protein n=2 Tax=Micromonospora rhizosphaerae TaxID=568872 RepID=A0A1C6SPR1_9ACTN|nr:hypothetical protein GA0070624_4302 [Micromonospora rhizosphaerae]
MSRDEVDFAIVGLVAAHDRISAAMYALDAHPGLVVLRGDDLRGKTRRVAIETLPRLDVLWSQFAAVRSVLDRVKTVRGERSRPGDDELHELTVLLRGPVLPLAPDGMVVDDPLAGAPPNWVTAMGLAQELERASAEVTGTLDGVQSAYAEIAARFEPLTKALDRARAAAEALGYAATGSEVERLDVRLAEATFDAMCDLLDTAGPPSALAAEIEAVTARLADLTRLRDAYPDRVRRLRAAVDEVAAAEDETGRAYAVANEKIANPGLPPAPDAVPALRAHLAQLDQLHREQRWPRLADELSVVERSVAEARERAAHLREAAEGLLRRRAELRGRLDAYRARAGRLGLAEHAELAVRHRTAQDLLYTSPCDLPAATRAMVAYLRYLNELTERGHQ